MAQARWAGADPRSLGVAPDQAPLIAQARARGFASDVLVISGGVSAGALRSRRAGAGPLRRGLPLHQGGHQAGRAARVRTPRRQARLRPARQPRLRAQVTFDLFVRAALLRMQGARVVTRPARRGRARSSASPTARAAATTCPRACTSRAAGCVARAAALGGLGRRRRARARRTRSCRPGEPSGCSAEAGEKAPAILLGSFLERDDACLQKRSPRRHRRAPEPSRRRRRRRAHGGRVATSR